MNDDNMRRWATMSAGALLAAAGLRRGGRTGVLMSLAGGVLGAAGYMKVGSRSRSVFETPTDESWQMPRERLMDDAKAFSRSARRVKEVKGDDTDEVSEASDESFPASDPPSFTPTTSLGGHEPR